jgi:hypothetical protein
LWHDDWLWFHCWLIAVRERIDIAGRLIDVAWMATFECVFQLASWIEWQWSLRQGSTAERRYSRCRHNVLSDGLVMRVYMDVAEKTTGWTKKKEAEASFVLS